MTEHIIAIHPGGKVRSLAYHDAPDLTCLGPGRQWRASHVEPVWPVKRLLFHALRRLFGEAGLVADWTRRWRGPWQVRIVGHGMLPWVYWSRADAIAAEVEWFHRSMKGG